MSSMKVFNRVAEFFPTGTLVDTSGNCFNLFMEFPTRDGRQACVIIWDESVLFYQVGGKVFTKEELIAIADTEDQDSTYEHFVSNIEVIFDDSPIGSTSPHDFFDNNTMIEIGEMWSKYNLCFDKAMRGE